jgi:hypothetical protein
LMILAADLRKACVLISSISPRLDRTLATR